MTSHKSFKKAAGLMLVAVLASRLLGLVREMLIARQFGSTGAVSAYTAAFNLPDLLYFFLSSGALSSAFIPVFTERFKTGREREAWQIFSIIACFMGLVLTGGVIVCWIYARPLVSVLAVPGFVKEHPDLVPLTVLLTRIILPCQLFFFVGGLMMATLESRQKFSARAAGPVIYNIGIIFGALVLSHWFDISGLAIGTLIGAFAGNIGYTYYCMRKEGFEFHPSLNFRHPGVVKVAMLALPVVLGLGLPQIDVIINRWFASFVSDTAPAALNYANRLMQVPLGIFAQAAGTAILPMLSAYAAKNAIADMRSGVAYGLRAIMVESLPATVFIIVMADPLVRTIYMGGEFRPSNVPATVVPLIWYSVGIFAWAGQRIIAPGFFALQDTITPVIIGTVSTIIFIPLNFFLMHAMGTGGIALSTTIGISLHFLGMAWYLRRRLGGLEGRQTLLTVGKTLVAAALMGVVCFGVRLGMARVIGSWQLQDGDIRQPAAMATMLEREQTPLSDYLVSKLSDQTKQMATAQKEVDRLTPRLRSMIIATLNEQILGAKLYEKRRFAGIDVPPGVRAAAGSLSRAGEQANRSLLSAAYPDVIAQSTGFLSRLVRQGGSKGSEWLLASGDIGDLHALIEQLTDPKNRVSVYLLSQMPDGARETMASYLRANKAAEDLPQSFMHDLNLIINRDAIYTPKRFAGIDLSHRMQLMASANPTGKRLAQLNRLLLQAAYPGQIAKRPAARVESKMGSFITVLVAMAVAMAVYFALLKVLKVTEMDYLWDAAKRKILRRPGGGGNNESGEDIAKISNPGPMTE